MHLMHFSSAFTEKIVLLLSLSLGKIKDCRSVYINNVLLKILSFHCATCCYELWAFKSKYMICTYDDDSRVYHSPHNTSIYADDEMMTIIVASP